jgi:hypothetical protein
VPLDPAGLTDALKAIFEGDGHPASSDDAGERWAQAYRDYAGGALAAPTAPLGPSLDAAGMALGASLAGAFAAAQAAGPAALVPTLSTAFTAFWLLPPIAFTSPPAPAPPVVAGVVTVAVPGALPAALTAALAAGVGGADAATQAQAFATGLDTFTRTVMVVNTPVTPPGPPMPPVPLV